MKRKSDSLEKRIDFKQIEQHLEQALALLPDSSRDARIQGGRSVLPVLKLHERLRRLKLSVSKLQPERYSKIKAKDSLKQAMRDSWKV
jgi:hypothetical protein